MLRQDQTEGKRNLLAESKNGKLKTQDGGPGK